MEAPILQPSMRILLAVDQTRSWLAASDEAIRLAREERADLIVLSVVEPHNISLPGGRIWRVPMAGDTRSDRHRLGHAVQQ